MRNRGFNFEHWAQAWCCASGCWRANSRSARHGWQPALPARTARTGPTAGQPRVPQGRTKPALGEHVFAHGTTICASALGALSPAALAAVTRTFTVLPPEDSPPCLLRRLRPRRNTNGRASAIFFAPFAPWRPGAQKSNAKPQSRQGAAAGTLCRRPTGADLNAESAALSGAQALRSGSKALR
jgi:hypothetical protein